MLFRREDVTAWLTEQRTVAEQVEPAPWRSLIADSSCHVRHDHAFVQTIRVRLSHVAI